MATDDPLGRRKFGGGWLWVDAGDVDYEVEDFTDFLISEVLRYLAELARIPSSEEYGFYKEFSNHVIYKLMPFSLGMPWLKDNALLEAERAVHDAVFALERLTGDQRGILAGLSRPNSYPDHVLTDLGRRFAVITGNPPFRPTRKKKKGRPKGEAVNWQFQFLVEALFVVPTLFGGKLTFNEEDRSKGGIATALGYLRKIFPSVVPNYFSLSTVGKIRERVRKVGPE